MSHPTISEVREFWNNHPLWTGESQFLPGSREFFEEHRSVCIEDCFAGRMDKRLFPAAAKNGKVLDLGCGIGFWLVEFGQRGYAKVHGADLTPNSLALARQRVALYGLEAELHEENAEQLRFPDATYDHVNCLGVVHHTPQPPQAVAEISRVLKPGGTASIAVYYKNIVIRHWRRFSWLSKLLSRKGAKLEGRGREGIYAADEVSEIIRLYDGKENPIGIGYTKAEFHELLAPHFHIDAVYFHFFPARSMPIHIPAWLHRLLDRRLPFMIYASLRKK